MSEEEIEQQLKKSRRQTKDERYEYINSHFNQTNYAMKLEKYALKLHKENQKLKDKINKAIEILHNINENLPLDLIFTEIVHTEYVLKGDKE